VLRGLAHGGQAPITGATVTLYAAGQPANVAPTTLGTATSDSNGNFNLQYTCPSSTALLYVVAKGGNAGAGANSAINLMAALGPCGSVPAEVVINELTTVAAVYALNAFSNVTPANSGGLGGCVDCTPGELADMTQLHGNTPAIANSFFTAGLLASVQNGGPGAFLPPAAGCVATSPPLNCVALERLTALANSLAACVNSAQGSAACGLLLSNHSVALGTYVAGTDTLQATLFVARNPGRVNIASLYGLSARNVVFAPGLPAAPTDWTISIGFLPPVSGSGVAIDASGNVWVAARSGVIELSGSTATPLSGAGGFTGGGLQIPTAIAIDGNDNVWVAGSAVNSEELLISSVAEFSGSTGAPLSPPGVGFTGGGIDEPDGVAIDAQGNVWVANEANSVTRISNGNTEGFIEGGLDLASGIAIDGNGNVWVSDLRSNAVTELSGSSGTGLSPITGFSGGGLNSPHGIATDGNGNVWVADSSAVTELDGATGMALSPAGGFVGGGIAAADGIAIDGNGNVWVADNLGAVSELSGATGAALSPTSGFTGDGLISPYAIAIDGSGNVWVSNDPLAPAGVIEIIGAAAPVITPLVAQISAWSTNKLTSIAVTPSTASVSQGATQQFVATGSYTDGTSANITEQVTWSSSNTAVASVNSSGLAACVGNSATAVPITASLTQSSGTITSAPASLTCTPPAVTLESITVSPTTASIAAGATQQFTASGLNSDGSTSTPTVTWSVQGGSSNGTISADGLYTAPNAAVSATVVATSTVNSAISATATVTVAAPTVEVNPPTASVATGAQEQFTATVLNDVTTTVTWSVDEGSAGGSVTAAGLYTAPASAGTFHVRATSTADTAAYGEATVTVTAATPLALSVATGEYSACALISGGTIQCWGFDGYGQLGDGSQTSSVVPVPVSGLTTATALSVGSDSESACALLADGTVYCWGSDGNSQLGSFLGSGGFSDTPIQVPGITTAIALSTAENVACAVLSGGAVECWGYDGYGALGDGSGNPLVTGPIAVSGITTATAVAVGVNAACALLADGTVQCWGVGGVGQLGNGTLTSAQLTPTTVTGIGSATSISVSGNTACAVLANHTIECWGSNQYGQLGNGSTTLSSVPVAVQFISTAIQVSVAEDGHTCAVVSPGGVECWGNNNVGQLGDGTIVNQLDPQTVTGITNAVQVSANVGFSCATLANGSVQCWGSNSSGQLGNDSTTYSLVPIPVSGL